MTSPLGGSHIPRTHLVLIEALRQIDAACKELGITYWVDGGTLLGTVRHRGPIPWDDDVDVCMLRDGLEQFVNRAPALLGEEYSIQTSHNDSAIAVSAKIYINGTHIRSKFAEANGLPATQHDGLYVDVTVMDRVSHFAILRRVNRAISWLVRTHPWARHMAKSPRLASSKLRLRWTVASLVPEFFVAGGQRWLDWCATHFDATLFSVDVAGLFNGWLYPSRVIFPLGDDSFGGLTVPVPADPHAYLVGEYGSDYMTLPPADQRVTHTESVLFDDK